MSKNNTSWNISVSFYKNYLSKPVVVELKTDKKANQKPYKKWLINLVCSVCTVRKPQANTFPYRPRTRLVSL